MPNLQPSYTNDIPIGFAGMIANGEEGNRISRSVEDVAGIPFGRAVFRGALDYGCTATPSATKFLGVTIANDAVQPLAGAVTGGVAADIYPQRESAGILNEGVIFVTAGEAVLAGDAAYVTAAGVINKTSAGNTAIPAVFDKAASANAIVPLRVRKS